MMIALSIAAVVSLLVFCFLTAFAAYMFPQRRFGKTERAVFLGLVAGALLALVVGAVSCLVGAGEQVSVVLGKFAVTGILTTLVFWMLGYMAYIRC